MANENFLGLISKLSEALKNNENTLLPANKEKEEDKNNDVIRYSTGVVAEAHDDRKEELEEAFADFKQYAANAKSIVNQNFTSAALKDYESHSPFLQKEATLVERVRSLFGRK